MSIFTEGKVLKNQLMERIKDILVGAGWTYATTVPTTEYYILTSTGESGDKKLAFQYRGLPINGSATGDINTTTAVVASYRLIGGYENGTIARPSEAWKSMNISSAVVDPEVELTYWYTVNKDRLIMNIYTPESLANTPVLWYFGLPTTFTPEPDGKGFVAMTSYASSQASVLVADNVAELPTSNSAVVLTNYIALAPKSPNSSGVHTPAELLYGNTSIGIRGKIDSLYFLPNGSVNDGDILRVGARRYRATQLGTSSNNSFPSPTVVYQIS